MTVEILQAAEDELDQAVAYYEEVERVDGQGDRRIGNSLRLAFRIPRHCTPSP